MKLKKVIVSALCCSLCFGTVFYTAGCSKMKAEKERIAAEQTAEAKRLAEAEAKAKAQAEEEARKAAEKAAEDAERERKINELLSMSLEEIIENNDLHFIVDNNVEICKENNRWYCSSEGNAMLPVFLTSEITDDVLNVYYSNENGNITYKETENGPDYNYPTYIDYHYLQTKRFSITKSQLIEYLVTKDYKLPEAVDCDIYDDSIQYFNPVNNITAVVVADYASVKDAPRGVGDIQNVAELNKWDEINLFGRTVLSASLDGTREEPFYLISVKNEKSEIIPGWIHGDLIKIFRSNSDLEMLKFHFTETDNPVLVPGVEYSGKKVPVQGKVLSYYGYDENNPVIDSIESFLNYYTDSELENVKEFYLDFANPKSKELNPALGDVGYGEIPSLESIERMLNLEKLYFGDSIHIKSLKGIENLKNLKELIVCYESLSDEDKTFLEPFKTDLQDTFYFNGYKGEDKEEPEFSKDMNDFLWEYKNSEWISDFDSKDFYKYDRSKTDDKYYNFVTTEDNVYVKTGITRDDKIMTVINKGEKLHIVSKSEKTDIIGDREDFWYMVELRNGIKGWIFGAYIYNSNRELDADSEIAKS